MEKQFKEFTAKTVEEAVEEGLKELGIAREDAEIVVLEEGKKKLFGYVKARVQIAPKTVEEEEAEEEIVLCDEEEETVEAGSEADLKDGERAVEFLDGLFKIMKTSATSEVKSTKEKIVIEVTAVNGNEIIGKRGATLDALQTLASAVANTGREEYVRVGVDCEGYRNKREATLTKLADNLATKAIAKDRKIRLEPMNPYERRIIHAALTDRDDVTTVSEGKEPNRYIVIIPANLTDDTLPPLPARDDRRGGGRGDRRGGRNGGGRGGFNKNGKGGFRGGNRPKPAGGGKKPTSLDFFGTFLGNSKDN